MVRQVGWLAPPATRHRVRAGLIRRGWRFANQMGTTHVAPDHTPTHLTQVSKQKGNRAMSSKTVFEVYTHFGRVISRHVCDHSKELHHRAKEEARMACAAYPGVAWVRTVTR